MTSCCNHENCYDLVVALSVVLSSEGLDAGVAGAAGSVQFNLQSGGYLQFQVRHLTQAWYFTIICQRALFQ